MILSDSEKGEPFRRLLELLGYDEGSQIVVCFQAKGPHARFTPAPVIGITAAQKVVSDRVRICDVWVETNSMQPINSGRGSDALTVRLAALTADLDAKAGGLDTIEKCHEVVDKLTAYMGTPPAVVVHSGGGLQPYWPITDGVDIPRAGAQLKRWRELVERCAEEVGGKVDATFDLARCLRVPGTYNRKREPVLVTAEFVDDFESLTLDEVDDLFSAAGITQRKHSETPDEPSTMQSPATNWANAEKNCHYVEAMISGWQTDQAQGGRHSWLVSQATRLAAAHRLGCLADYELASQLLGQAFERILAVNTGDPQARTTPDHKEIERALIWGIEKVETMTEEQVRDELKNHEHRPTSRAAVVNWHSVDLERDVFTATPELGQVRDVARHAMLSPWAVLGAIMARLLALTEPSLTVPAFIGSSASLNFATVLVGPSGSGKTSAATVAARMLTDGPHVDVLTPSSGEGLVALFAERDGKGETAALVRNRCLTVVDEIASLGGIQDRNGSTLAATIRSAISGSALSNYSADPTRRRAVAEHAYRWCIVAGAQLGTARVLLDDADGGTPQRFLWVAADDPHAVDNHPEPGALELHAPRVTMRGPLIYPDQVGAEVRANRLRIMTGESGALDGHAVLVRLKVAAALALLHSRATSAGLIVDGTLWHISGLILEHSDRVRSRVLEHHRREAEREHLNRGRMDAAREIGASDELLERAALAIARKVERASEPLKRQAVRDSVGRRRVNKSAAIDLAIERRWIAEVEVEGERLYQAGAVKVAP
jgi:hypothetical protein